MKQAYRVCLILYTAPNCSWLSPTEEVDVIECSDGSTCHIETKLGWGCCRNKGRNKCPANFPVMCAINSCGRHRNQYCCAESEDKCIEYYGVKARKCDSKGRLLQYKRKSIPKCVIKKC